MRRIFLSMRRLVGIFAARSAVNMPDYIHDRDDWPAFCWSAERLAAPLAAVARRQGRFAGRMEALGFRLREAAVLETLTEDVMKDRKSVVTGKMVYVRIDIGGR